MMDKLSIPILCFIFLNGVVHSCYYETYYRGTYITNYESCLAGCCEPSVPGAQKPCCDDTGVIVGICIGVVGFIIVCVAVILYYRRRKRNASNNNYSHNERAVLIPPPTTYSPAT